MKKINFFKYLPFVFIMSMTACVTFAPVSLNDDEVEEDDGEDEDEGGVPALAFKGGNLLEGNWWTGTTGDMTLTPKNGEFIIACRNVGSKYTPFGMEMGAVDFTGDVTIRLKARCDAENTMVLSLQFDDFEGAQANGARPTKRIHVGEDYRDYCFKVDNSKIWSQTWPDNRRVNGKLIQKIMFFPNAGGPDWTGKLYIKEMQVIKSGDGCDEQLVKLPVGKNGGVIASADDKFEKWWASDGFKKEWNAADSSMKLVATNVGPKYDAFGTGLPFTVNALNAQKLKVTARIDGDVPPELRFDLKDPDDFTTNSRPATARIYPTPDGSFKTYTINFKDRFLQTWPDRHEVDGRRIINMVCFANAGKAPWTGNIYIKKMEFVFTGEVADDGGDDQPLVEDDPANTLVDDFTKPIYSWWSDEKLALKKVGSTLEVTASGAGEKFDGFGRAFQAIDFTKTPILVVKAKASAECQLRVDLKDIDEYATNSSPVVQTIKTGDFVEYKFDFTGKFKQKDPAEKKVNPKEILETIFFINPGGPAFSGKLFVEDIRAIKKE